MQYLISHYVVNFDPFAIHFPEGFPLDGIRWYGLAYLSGFLIAYMLLTLYSRKNKSPLSVEDNSNLVTYLLFGVIIGGRLGYMLFYDLDNFFANPLILFQIWKGGMASHGGFIGVLLGIFTYAKVHKKSFWAIADVVVTVSTPGIFLGRLANFINGELWGKVSDAPWAMIFPNSAPNLPIADVLARHPSQLYEAFFEGLLIFVILQFRFWKFKLPKGQIAGEFLVIYAIGRILCELFREPDVGVELIMGLSRGTFYSILTLIAGILMIAYARFRKIY